jgi:hypothetical protein
MGSALHTIPILPADPGCAPAAGCGGCVRGTSAGPICLATLGEPCAAPTLTGPADELARLLTALTPVLGALESSGLVRALTVQDGEVELQLALRADCGGAELADNAFQVLRGLLPDTDIYVLPAR